MNIGVLKEIRTDEKRVALLPDQVRVLSHAGHHVSVETQAGGGSGFTDSEYAAAGATVLSKSDVLERAQLLLKVKAPLREEYRDYRSDQTLFTFLHFDENIAPTDIAALVASGVLGIAYEWVGTDGQYPILAPMSRLSGYLFAQKACELCLRHKGVFHGGNEAFLPSAAALVIGLGNIGLSALRYFLDNKLRVTVVDKATPAAVNMKANSRFRTCGVDYVNLHDIEVIEMNMADPIQTKGLIADRLAALDIMVCAAVRRPTLPKARLAYLVDRAMISRMSPGSVVCDATANDRDLIETCISSASVHGSYEVDGVIHYNCDHIPALAARTASQLLTQASFPYVLELAERGSIGAIKANAPLRSGVSCFKGYMTHQYSAEKKGLPWRPVTELLRH